jgi:hypothetical protein
MSAGALELFVEENNATLVELATDELQKSGLTSDHEWINSVQIFFVLDVCFLQLSIVERFLLSVTFNNAVHLALASLAHLILSKLTAVAAFLTCTFSITGDFFCFLVVFTIVVFSVLIIFARDSGSFITILFFGIEIAAVPIF